MWSAEGAFIVWARKTGNMANTPSQRECLDVSHAVSLPLS